MGSDPLVQPSVVCLGKLGEPVDECLRGGAIRIVEGVEADVDSPLVGLRIVLSSKGFTGHPHLGEGVFLNEFLCRILGIFSFGKDQQVVQHLHIVSNVGAADPGNTLGAAIEHPSRDRCKRYTHDHGW